jgi:hypothetical protein
MVSVMGIGKPSGEAMRDQCGAAVFLPPLQGEGRGGDGLHLHGRIASNRTMRSNPSPPNPPLEGEGFMAHHFIVGITNSVWWVSGQRAVMVFNRV